MSATIGIGHSGAITTPASSAPAQAVPALSAARRNAGLDALRAALTLFVPFHHSAITYGAFGGRYYHEVQTDLPLGPAPGTQALILADAPIEISGFSLDEIDQIVIGDEADAVENGPLAPDPGAVPVARLDGIFQLAPHRIICGDARDPMVFRLLMHGPARAQRRHQGRRSDLAV